jgi:hypothetical protein
MKKLIAIAVIGFMSLTAFGQQDTTKSKVPSLPESVFQEDMSIIKDKTAKTLVMTFKVANTFNNADIESIKCYVHFYYGANEGYIGWTPQVSHKGDIWTFTFNK